MIYYARLATGNIKIGCTTMNLGARVRYFAREMYGREAVYILGVHDGDRDLEKALHRKFDHLRIKVRTTRYGGHGAWPEDFRPEPDLIDYIRENRVMSPVVDEANRVLVEDYLKRKGGAK